jgi:DNA modification methylase
VDKARNDTADKEFSFKHEIDIFKTTMSTKHTIIIGDSRSMDDVENSSVHHIVTSPPYWQLKDYGTEDQIGFNDSYEDYINNLNLVWLECFRVLHPGCRMVVNIGDQFARSVYYGRYKIMPIRTEVIKFCETIGFDYMGAIIWQKKTTMNTSGGATVMGSFPYPRNGIVEIDYEFILIFKKPGVQPEVSKEIKEKSALSKGKWKEYFSGHWTFAGARQQDHIAMFPVELPKRTIEMFSFVGDTVLDPFVGSGTTSLAAKVTGRNSIGYEINKEFLPIIKEKLKIREDTLFQEAQLFIHYQKETGTNWKQKIARQKYIFRDPVRFDKKANSKKLSFGSRISLDDRGSESTRETYYIVKEIIGPNLIKLNNDQIIRLMGVKPVLQKESEAIHFLHKKILKGQVYLKYDKMEYDEENRLLAYVYMKNKTFINAHLLKKDFCEIDDSYDFKYRKKFEAIRSKNFQQTDRN